MFLFVSILTIVALGTHYLEGIKIVCMNLLFLLSYCFFRIAWDPFGPKAPMYILSSIFFTLGCVVVYNLDSV